MSETPARDDTLALEHESVEDVRIVVELWRRSSRFDGQTVTGSRVSCRLGFSGEAARAWRSVAITSLARSR